VHERGTTILELLVALGVIAIMLALGSSAAVSVRREARAATCSSNLQQIALATESYRNQYEGRLPAAVLYHVREGELVTSAWDFVQTQSGEIAPGALWSFTDGPAEVHQCPEHVGPSTFGNDPFTGYNYNTTYLGAEGRLPWLDDEGTIIEGWNAARQGMPPALHRAPDRCALYGDAGWRGGSNKFMRAPSNMVEHDLATVYAGGQSFRHGGCCNIVHLDGHCSRYCEAFEGKYAEEWLLEDVMGYPSNGFLDESDGPYDPSQ
jgi:prepilin-type processing-associated H-X9-DG protein